MGLGVNSKCGRGLRVWGRHVWRLVGCSMWLTKSKLPFDTETDLIGLLK